MSIDIIFNRIGRVARYIVAGRPRDRYAAHGHGVAGFDLEGACGGIVDRHGVGGHVAIILSQSTSLLRDSSKWVYDQNRATVENAHSNQRDVSSIS